MLYQIVNVKDNIDCYRFDLDFFIKNIEYLKEKKTDINIIDFINLIVSSYGIIGNTVTKNLLYVMYRDIKDININLVLRNSIELTRCIITNKYSNEYVNKKWKYILNNI